MLVFGAQVLLGFQFRAAFEEGFEALPVWSQALLLCGLGLMLLAVGLLVAPTAYHRIVERGEDTEELRKFTSRVMLWALLPFAFALGLNLFVAGEQIVGRKWAVAAGFVVLAAGLFFWYLLEFYHRRARAGAAAPERGPNSIVAHVSAAPAPGIMSDGTQAGEAGVVEAGAPPGTGQGAARDLTQGSTRVEEEMTAGDLAAGVGVGGGAGRRGDEPRAGGENDPRERMDAKPDGRDGDGGRGGASISDRIDQVLTDARVLLPGAQALLGFQFIAVLTESFTQLPDGAKYVHLLSLLMMALTIILLMTPAAYHRIVEQGDETEHFHRFASRFVVAALVPLALGISGDVYVVVRKVTDSQLLSVVSALVSLAMFWELWFGLTLYRRTQRRFAD